MSIGVLIDGNSCKKIYNTLGISIDQPIGMAKVICDPEDIMTRITSELSPAQLGKTNLKNIEKNLGDIDKFTGDFIIVGDSYKNNLTLKRPSKTEKIAYKNTKIIEVALLADSYMLNYLQRVTYVEEPGNPLVIPHANVTDGKGIIKDGRQLEFDYKKQLEFNYK